MGVKQHLVLRPGALFHVMWLMWSWLQKPMWEQKQCPDLCLVSCSFIRIYFSCHPLRAFADAILLLSCLFNPSCPFHSIQTMLTCNISFHTPSDRPSNKADTDWCREPPLISVHPRGRDHSAQTSSVTFFVFASILIWQFDFLIACEIGTELEKKPFISISFSSHVGFDHGK